MKRYISLACVALVVIMCMLSPVSAADLDSEFIELLDYTSVDSQGNFFYFQSSSLITLKLPSYSQLYYVDVLFALEGTSINSVSVLWGNTIQNLTLIPVGSNLFRAYGSVPVGNYLGLDLQFTNNGTYSYITLLSCRVSSINVNSFDSECYCAIATVDYDRTIHYIPGDEINYRSFTGTNDPLTAAYRLDIYNLDWRKYDFVDYLLYLSVDSVTSVLCEFDGMEVPCSVSYLNNQDALSNDFLILIRVDCRNLDRSKTGVPYVSITGNVVIEHSNLVSVMSCNGLVSQNYNIHFALLRKILDVISIGFVQLNQWIDSQTQAIISALTGDSSAADQMQQEVNQKADELEELSGVMNSVSKPSTESVNVSVDSYIDQNVLTVSMAGLSSVMSMPIFSEIFIMAIILATAGYVLFGKR